MPAPDLNRKGMKKLLLFGLAVLLIAGCSSEGDLPETKPVTPVAPSAPDELTDTTGEAPATPIVKTYPARYGVAQMDITVDGNRASLTASNSTRRPRYSDWQPIRIGCCWPTTVIRHT